MLAVDMRGQLVLRFKSRATKALATALTIIGLAGTGVLVTASPAAAATICYAPVIGWNAASGGCDNDGTLDTRLGVRCRVIGSYYEYVRYTNWKSRYTSWVDTVWCYGGTARARSAWYEGRR